MIDPATAAALLAYCRAGGAFALAYQNKARAAAAVRRVLDDAEIHRTPLQSLGPLKNAVEAEHAADRRLANLTPQNAHELAFKLAVLLLDFESGQPHYAEDPVFWSRLRAELQAFKV